MHFEVLYPGNSAMVMVKLDRDDSFKAEAGAMISKSEGVHIESCTDGGFLRSLRRKWFGGESFFLQTLKAADGEGEVHIAPVGLGDIKILDVKKGHDFFVQSGAFLAAFGDITVDTKLQGSVQGMFSGEGAFVLHLVGTGDVAVSAFGSLHELELPAGKVHTVDQGHLVGWSGGIKYSIEKVSKSWFHSWSSGEGAVCRLEGPGSIWMQTRNEKAYGRWMKQSVLKR